MEQKSLYFSPLFLINPFLYQNMTILTNSITYIVRQEKWEVRKIRGNRGKIGTLTPEYRCSLASL